jgi:hypothetical protein
MGCPFNNFGARGMCEGAAQSRTDPTATAMGPLRKWGPRTYETRTDQADHR